MSDSEDMSHYDMNVLEEYMSLFGNPYTQTTSKIISNVKSLLWPDEEIMALFEEMLDDTYENLTELDDQFDIHMCNNYIVNMKSSINKLKGDVSMLKNEKCNF